METLKPYQFFFLFLLICLAACTSGASAFATSTVPGTVTPLLARSSTPLLTKILFPTLRPTDTLSPIPEATATPDVAMRAAVTSDSFANFNFDTGFIPVSHEQAVGLSNDIIQSKNSKLQSDVSVTPVRFHTADGYQVWIYGEIGVNLFPRFAISEQMEHGTGHFILWEVIVKDKDGHNKRESLKMSFEPEFLNYDPETKGVSMTLSHIAKLTYVDIHLVTDYEGGVSPGMNPVIQDVVGGENPVRQKLQKGIIDDETGTVPIYNRDIMSP